MQNPSNREQIEQIKAANDLTLIAEEFGITLKRSGRERVGLCPFHDERTPSFSINPQKQVYLCRGCGAKGDVIRFAEMMRGTGWGETVEWLAERQGIEYTKPQKIARKRKSNPPRSTVSTEAVLNSVAQIYSEMLRHHPEARAYLKERGISDDLIGAYNIGYAPQNHNLVEDVAQQLAQPPAVIDGILLETGLIKPGNSRSFIQHRIVFPIINMKGNVCAFSGRQLSDASGPAKYLNTCESNYFKKRETVFGLTPWDGLAREYRSHWKPRLQADTAIVVEGYTDVLALSDSGLHPVAAMGTAFSTQHHQQLRKRGYRSILFCFDGDNAGQVAARRTCIDLITEVRDDEDISFIQLPSGSDPDDFVNVQGGTAFMDLKRLSLGEFWIEAILRDCPNIGAPESTVQAHAALDRIEAQMSARLLAAELRKRLERRVGTHPLEKGHFDVIDPDDVHRSVSMVIHALAATPSLKDDLELPQGDWARQRITMGSERSLKGLNLLLQAFLCWPEQQVTDTWQLASEMQKKQYPAAWLATFLHIAHKKTPSASADDVKRVWSELLRFAEVQQTVGLLWPLTK